MHSPQLDDIMRIWMPFLIGYSLIPAQNQLFGNLGQTPQINSHLELEYTKTPKSQDFSWASISSQAILGNQGMTFGISPLNWTAHYQDWAYARWYSPGLNLSQERIYADQSLSPLTWMELSLGSAELGLDYRVAQVKFKAKARVQYGLDPLELNQVLGIHSRAELQYHHLGIYARFRGWQGMRMFKSHSFDLGEGGAGFQYLWNPDSDLQAKMELGIHGLNSSYEWSNTFEEELHRPQELNILTLRAALNLEF